MEVVRSFGLIFAFVCGVFSEMEDQMGPTLVKKLTATCGKDGIKVSVRFSEPFSGIVYSDGFYDKPQCVFINQENYTFLNRVPPETRFSFLIPADECGTVFHDPGSKLSSKLDDEDDDKNNAKNDDKNELANEVYMENTIMFQKNHFIQEQGDLLQKLRCVWQKEIRRPLHATLPLRGKLKHEKVKVIRPIGSLNKQRIVHLQTQEPIVQRPTAQETISPQPANQNEKKHHHNANGQISRKRFQPIGQVESVSPFSVSVSRRNGKSLEYQYEPPKKQILSSDAYTFGPLPNLTALPFKQDDLSGSSSTSSTSDATSGFRMTFSWVVIPCTLLILKETLF